jgi:hypothetical protein
VIAFVIGVDSLVCNTTFQEQSLQVIYQKLLSAQLGAGIGMLSVDDTSFVKKENILQV